jgi:hypothetical protein
MGAFASMAQNSYGLRIMGGVAFVFGLVFLAEIFSALRKQTGKRNPYELIEPACLFVLSVVFGFRVFYIHFPYVEFLFATAAVLLAIVYLVKMIYRYQHFERRNNFLSMLLLLYHSSIILFLGSLALVPFAPKIGEFSGAAALILLLVFIIAGTFKKNLLVDGEIVSAVKMVRRFRDHSVIIVSLFLLFSLYVGFNRVGILPDIYTDEFPRAYFKLVDEASSRKEKAVGGRYKYEDFMEEYQLFLKHHNSKNK